VWTLWGASVPAHTHMHTHMHTFTRTCTRTLAHTHTHAHSCAHAHACTHTHTYTHTHARTQGEVDQRKLAHSTGVSPYLASLAAARAVHTAPGSRRPRFAGLSPADMMRWGAWVGLHMLVPSHPCAHGPCSVRKGCCLCCSSGPRRNSEHLHHLQPREQRPGWPQHAPQCTGIPCIQGQAPSKPAGTGAAAGPGGAGAGARAGTAAAAAPAAAAAAAAAA